MSEKNDNILNQSNSEKELNPQYLNNIENNDDNKIPTIIENNNEDLNSYTYKNGNKLVLSGINLRVQENQELLKKLISSHLTAIDVDISNCNLNSFPEILFQLKHLSKLDLRNNEFQNFEELVQKLILLTNLTDLKIDLVDQNQVLMILSSIPRLIFLNGKSTKEAITIVDVDEKDIEDISLQNDLQVYNELVNKINMKEKDQNFVNDFQNKLYEEAEKVKACLNNNVPNYIYANVVIQSQFELQKILAKKFLSFLDENNKSIGEILFKSIFKSGERLVELMNNLYPRIEEKTDGLRTQLEEAWKSAEDIGDFENKFNEMRKLKDIMAGENELIKIKMNKLENENKVMMDKLYLFGNKMINSSVENNSINQMISKNSSTNNFNNESKHLINIESKIFLENDNNNNIINKKINNNNEKNIEKENNYPDLPKNKTDLNLITPKILSIKGAKDIMQEIYNNKTIYDQKCYENKIPRETLEQYMYTYLNQKYGLKNLIIEWASSIINAIKMYSSEDCDINLFGKILRNEQEEDSRLVLENLKNNVSELLEFYLSSKNPFKSKIEIQKMLKSKKEGILVEEEWKGIVNYIYTEEDAAIIQNKIITFIKKKSEKNLIPLSLYAQTGVGPTEIFNLTSGTIGSNNNNNILQNLSTFNYNSNLSSNLNGSNSMNYLLSYHGTNTKKLSREDIYNITKLNEDLNITYKDFLRLLCIYQIKNRDKYLKNFVQLFRKHDSDLDGILNENEFANLIRDIPYCKNNEDEYIFKFLSIIDPFNNKKITFSECVSLLSMEMVDENLEENTKGNDNGENKDKKEENNNQVKIKKNNRNKISLLDKICL